MQRFELRIKPVVENMLSMGTDDDDIDRKIAATWEYRILMTSRSLPELQDIVIILHYSVSGKQQLPKLNIKNQVAFIIQQLGYQN